MAQSLINGIRISFTAILLRCGNGVHFVSNRGEKCIVHTFEAQYTTTLHTLIRVMDCLHLSEQKKQEIRSYASSPHTMGLHYRCHEQYYRIPGIRRITCSAKKYRRDYACFWSVRYYIQIQVEPQMMICGMRTVDLFCCTPENIKALTDIFYMYLFEVFSMERIARLEHWNLTRIDYAINIRCDYPELFFDMIKRIDRHKIVYAGSYASSLEKKRKSSKFILYDKQEEIMDTQPALDTRPDIDAEEWNLYTEESQHIIRMEYQCYADKIQAMKAKCPELRCYEFNFGLFDEYLGNSLLYKEYTETIGTGDFYKYRNDAIRRIAHSPFTEKMKIKLRCTMMLCARARHVREAEKQFTTGTMVRDNRNAIEFQGSKETFRRYIRQLESIGIAPVPIPKEWYSSNPKYGRIPNVIPNPIPEEWKQLSQELRNR